MTRVEKFEALEYMEKWYRCLYNESVDIDNELARERSGCIMEEIGMNIALVISTGAAILSIIALV